MPKILEINGYKFYIYTDDHLPIHVHVWKGGAEAKVTLVPQISIQANYGFKAKQLKQIIKIIVDNYNHIIEKWYETHGR
jgi:hypothetical protein